MYVCCAFKNKSISFGKNTLADYKAGVVINVVNAEVVGLAPGFKKWKKVFLL
jgi:hypothetical protein